MDLVAEVYRVTKCFPAEERFGLTSQLRRASVSIPANIAEGYGRASKPAFANFARIVQGSLYELRTELEVAIRVGVASREALADSITLAGRLSRMLDGFVRSLESQSPANR
ncbi:MAG: four helix bundle protein [Fimbriimonas sp.]